MKAALASLLLLSLALSGCAGPSTGGTEVGVSGGEIPPEGIGIDLGDDGTALPQAVGTGEVALSDISEEDLSLDDLAIDISDDGTVLPEQVS